MHVYRTYHYFINNESGFSNDNLYDKNILMSKKVSLKNININLLISDVIYVNLFSSLASITWIARPSNTIYTFDEKKKKKTETR